MVTVTSTSQNHIFDDAKIIVIKVGSSLLVHEDQNAINTAWLSGIAADIARLATAREPWSLSNLAIAAARACLSADDFCTRTLETIPLLRAELQRGLERLGWQVFAGEANYLLCRLPDGWCPALQLATQLRPQGLLLRACGDFIPLDARYLRLAVLGEEQNRRLLAALGAVAPGAV